MNENELSHLIIKCALKVHSTLGPGLLESAYESCLHYELQKAGLFFQLHPASRCSVLLVIIEKRRELFLYFGKNF